METDCNNKRTQKSDFAYRKVFIFDLKCSVSLILNHVHLRTFIPIIVVLCWKSPNMQLKTWICSGAVLYGGGASCLMPPGCRRARRISSLVLFFYYYYSIAHLFPTCATATGLYIHLGPPCPVTSGHVSHHGHMAEGVGCTAHKWGNIEYL